MKHGDSLRVQADDRACLEQVRELDAVDELIGAYPGLSEATDLEGLRAEWEK